VVGQNFRDGLDRLIEPVGAAQKPAGVATAQLVTIGQYHGLTEGIR